MRTSQEAIAPYIEVTGKPGSAYLRSLRSTVAAILGELMYSYDDVLQGQVLVEEMYRLILQGSPGPVLDPALRLTTAFAGTAEGLEVAMTDPFGALERSLSSWEGEESASVIRALADRVEVEEGPPHRLRVLRRPGGYAPARVRRPLGWSALS